MTSTSTALVVIPKVARPKLSKSTNPYKVLGVRREASPEEIKKAFQRLSMLYHPDRGGSEKEFLRIQKAYNILSDSNTRDQYDADGIYVDLTVTQEVKDNASALEAHYFSEILNEFKNSIIQESNNDPLDTELFYATLTNIDLVSAYKGINKQRIKELNNNIVAARKVMKGLKRLNKHVVRKGDDAPDMYKAIYQNQVSAIQKDIVNMLKNKLVHEVVEDRLDQYEMRETQEERAERLKAASAAVNERNQAARQAFHAGGVGIRYHSSGM